MQVAYSRGRPHGPVPRDSILQSTADGVNHSKHKVYHSVGSGMLESEWLTLQCTVCNVGDSSGPGALAGPSDLKLMPLCWKLV